MASRGMAFRRRVRRPSFLAVLATLLLAGARVLAETESLPPGQILEKVACRSDPSETYALYLPSTYSADRAWPVIYALDPGARGRAPVERFRQAAEVHGYIVVGSRNSRNGPMEPTLRSLIAMINDTRQRFSVNPKRTYLAGFSGGARAATVFVRLRQTPVAAVIACGAGLSPGLAAKELPPTYFLGIVGVRDFNYLEMRDLDRRMTSEKVAHRLIVTDGQHSWPSEDTCLRAVEWLELQAMVSGLRPRDASLLDTAYRRETDAGRNLEDRGDWTGAVLAYDSVSPLFAELRGVDELGEKVRRIRQGDEFRRQAKQEAELERRERAWGLTLQQVVRSLSLAPLGDVNLARALDDLGVARLVKDLRKTAEVAESQLASRLLMSLTVAARSDGWRLMDQRDYPRASLFFEAGLAATAHDPARRSDLQVAAACADAAAGHDQRALSRLRQAVADGFGDREAIERESCFDGLRKTAAFGEILGAITDKSPVP